MPVIGRVLRDQDELAHTVVAQAAGLVEDRVEGAADRRAFDERDGAEGAWATATVGDLQVGRSPCNAGAEDGQAARLAHRIRPDRSLVGKMIKRPGVRRLAKLTHDLDDIHPSTGAQDAIDTRNLMGHFCAVTLGQAARGDEDLTGALVFSQRAQHIKRFLLGRADEAAGIDDQDICPGRIAGHLIAITQK